MELKEIIKQYCDNLTEDELLKDNLIQEKFIKYLNTLKGITKSLDLQIDDWIEKNKLS